MSTLPRRRAAGVRSRLPCGWSSCSPPSSSPSRRRPDRRSPLRRAIRSTARPVSIPGRTTASRRRTGPPPRGCASTSPSGACRATPRACGWIPPSRTAATASARGGDGHPRARARHAGGVPRTGAVPITDMARSFDRRQPVVVDQHAHPQAPAHLVGDRREPREAQRHDAHRPPGPQPRREHPLRRRAAPPQGRPRAHAEGAPGLPGVPRSPAEPQPRGEPPPRHMERIFRDLRRADIPRRNLYLAWDFTVGSERNLTGRMTAIRDDAFARLGDTDLADLRARRPVAGLHDRRGSRLPAGEDANIARKVSGTSPCRATSTSRLPARRPVPSTRTARRPRHRPGNGRSRPSSSATSRVGRLRAPRRRALALRPRAAREAATEIDQLQLRRLSQEHDFVVCATTGAGWPTRTSRNIAALLGRTCRASRRWPTACSRACWTCCTSAGR